MLARLAHPEEPPVLRCVEDLAMSYRSYSPDDMPPAQVAGKRQFAEEVWSDPETAAETRSAKWPLAGAGEARGIWRTPPAERLRPGSLLDGATPHGVRPR